MAINSKVDELHAELVERIEKNYSDYKISLLEFSKQEIIDMAGKISAMSDAHSYMTAWHDFDNNEIRFYLKFQNPLEIVADSWHERDVDLDDMSLVMYDIYDKQDVLESYPLTSDTEAYIDNSLRRFMEVDLIDFLGKIADKVVIHSPNDWEANLNILYKAANSDNLDEKRFIWYICSYGAHMPLEREVFVRGTADFDCWKNYHANDPDMFVYIIEVTGQDELSVTGNVFEVGNYVEFAKYIFNTALPLNSVSITYRDVWNGDMLSRVGETVTVSREEYERDRIRLRFESGPVSAVRFNPADEARLTALLQQERSNRMAYPIGSQEIHLKKLSEKLAKVRKPPEQQKTSNNKHEERNVEKMTIGEKLYEKLSAEFNAFIEDLKSKPPDEIINSAYEKVTKEAILQTLDTYAFNGIQIAALLTLEKPLASLYEEWQNTEDTYMEMLRDSVDNLAKKLIDENGISVTADILNGVVGVGDWVIAEPNDEYGCLVGVVERIEKLGTPEHSTDNETDDIHVDFMAIEYSAKTKAEFFEAFNHENMDAESFDDLPLDDVIMAPDMLIQLKELEYEEISRLANDYKAAKAYCEGVLNSPVQPELPKKKSIGERLKSGKEKSDSHKVETPANIGKNKKEEVL